MICVCISSYKTWTIYCNIVHKCRLLYRIVASARPEKAVCFVNILKLVVTTGQWAFSYFPRRIMRAEFEERQRQDYGGIFPPYIINIMKWNNSICTASPSTMKFQAFSKHSRKAKATQCDVQLCNEWKLVFRVYSLRIRCISVRVSYFQLQTISWCKGLELKLCRGWRWQHEKKLHNMTRQQSRCKLFLGTSDLKGYPYNQHWP